MFKLSLLQDGSVFEYTLGAGELLIGRQPDCDIQLEYSEVSRHHARLRMTDGAYRVEDLDSSNGTLVNGSLIQAPTRLKDGDRLSLGSVELRYHQILNPAAPDEAKTRTVLSTQIHTIAARHTESTFDNRSGEKLRAVLSISRSLAESNGLDSHLPIILDSLFDIFPAADRGAVVLRDPGSDRFQVHLAKERDSSELNEPHVSATVLGRVFTEKIGILSADACSDARFDASKSVVNFNIRSVMCAPLLGLEGEAIGAISLDTRNAAARFSVEDLEVLTIVAGQAALSWENARLVAARMEQEKQVRDLEMARRIQQALLPPAMPQLPGYGFFAAYQPAAAVGGDYYDCFPTGDGKLCVALGDVAGKGVPASLLMSRLASVIHSSMRFVEDPAEAFRYINRHMCRCSVEGRFATLVIAIVDLHSHEVALLNGGHMTPIVRLANGGLARSEEESVGIPLGIVDDYPYGLHSLTLNPGDFVFLYSDGISEARNAQGELYGLQRLHAVLSQEHTDVAQFGAAILEDVRRHTGEETQSDDISLLCFGRKPA